MWTRYFGKFVPCAFGFLVLLQLTNSRPLEDTEKLANVRNLPEDQLSPIDYGLNSSTKSGPPGCCTPELYLGFENTNADKQELHGRRAQTPAVTSEEAPCGKYADLNAEPVKFNSAKLATQTDAITIAVWIKLHSQSGIQPILVVRGEVGELRFELTEGYLSWLYTATRPSLATFALLSTVPVVPVNVWTHLVVQYDAHTRRSAVFLNGKKILQRRSSGGSLEIDWGEFTSIAKHSINEVLEFKVKGYIDEFYIYHCAVPEMVIQRLAEMCHMEGKCAPVGPDGFCGPGEQTSVSHGRCVSCFCMGRSRKCSHAKLYRDKFQLEVKTLPDGPVMHLVDVNGDNVSGVKYTADQTNNELVAHNVSKQTQYYWALPKEFLGNQLASYGGKLRYTARNISKNPTGHARVVREIISFEAEYIIDRNSDEEENAASGLEDLTTNVPIETTRVTKMSYSGDVFTDRDDGETATKISETSSVVMGNDSLETISFAPSTTYITKRLATEKSTPLRDMDASTDVLEESTSFVSSTAYSATIEASTTIPDTYSPASDASTDSDDESTTVVPSTAYSINRTTTDTSKTTPDSFSTITDASTEEKDETTTSIPSSAHSTERPTSEAPTTILSSSFTVTVESSEDQDERTAYTSSSPYSTKRSTTKASTTIPDTPSTLTHAWTEDEDESTTHVPSSAYSSERPTTVISTTIQDASFTVEDASTELQDEKTTFFPSTSPSLDRATIETHATLTEVPTESQGEITTAVPSSPYKTEISTTEAYTTKQYTSYPVTYASTEGQDEITTFVPSAAYSSERPTAETLTTIPLEVSTIGEAPTEIQGGTITEVTFSAYRTEISTTEIIKTIPDTSTTSTEASTEDQVGITTAVSSSTYQTEKLTTEASTAKQHKPYQVTYVSTESQDKTTTSSYSTESPPTETLPTIPAEASKISEATTEGQSAVTSSAYKTDISTTEIVTTIPDASTTITEASAEGQETTTSVPSSVHSTDKSTKEIVTTIPDALTTLAEESTKGQDETTIFVSSSGYSTDKSTTEVPITKPDTFSTIIDASTVGQDEITTVLIPDTSSTAANSMGEGLGKTTIYVPSSHYSTNIPTTETSTTIPVTTVPKTDASAIDKKVTTTVLPSLALSTVASKTIMETSSTVTDASTEGKDTTTTSVVSSVDNTYRPTTEIPHASSTFTEAGILGQDETTASVFSSLYSTEIPTTEASTTMSDASTDDQDETITVIPSSKYTTDGPSTIIVTTISDTAFTITDASIDDPDKTTTFRPPSSKSTEKFTSSASTTNPDIFYIQKDASTGSQDKTTTYVPFSAYVTDGSTKEASTTIADTYSATTDADVQDETTTYVPPFSQSPKPTTSDMTTAIPETSTITITDASTDTQGKTTSYVPSSAYSTEEDTSEIVTKIPDTSSSITDASTNGPDKLTTVVSSSAHMYSTEPQTSETPTTIPEKTSTVQDGSTDRQDETTTSLFYSTDRPTTEPGTTIPDTFSGVTDALTEGHGETTTAVPSTTYRPRTETVTTIPGTSSTATEPISKVQNETTISVPSSTVSTEVPTTETVTTIPDAPSTVTNVSTEAESETTTATAMSSSAYSTKRSTSEASTTLTVTSSTVTDTSTSYQDGITPVAPSPTPTSEAASSTSDLTTPTSVKFTEAPYTPAGQITEAVRLVGKDTTLVFFNNEVGPNGGNSQTTMEVSLVEAEWRSPDGSQTSRDTFMRVLSDLQAIYVRASYSGDGSNAKSLGIKDLSLDVTSQHDAGFGKALLVEQCKCPVGYSGLSCEDCSPGFTRSADGLGCMRCPCNNHSDNCDQENGTCLTCQHNTEGLHCEKCLTGFYGNATIGKPTDCKECPCPMTSPPNRFSPTCFMAEDGQPTCDSCPPGYGGRRCDKCIKPYVGNPTETGAKCERVDCGCDIRGSVNNTCDPETGQCFCKKHVEGLTCDSCKRSFFNLQSDEPEGCVPCFCFQVSRDCKCANYYKDIFRMPIAMIEGPDYLRLADSSLDSVISSGIRVLGDPGHFVYDEFDKLPVATYYWFLGKQFRGDMMTSYDGILRYTVSHEMKPGGKLISEADVQLRGRGIVLIFRHGRRLAGGKKVPYGLKLSEAYLRFPDGGRVTRDNVMTVLSAVESILIRATYSTTTTQASLYDVNLEVAVPQETRYGKAKNIEECACPPEYTGTSCQRCAPGYTRSYSGPDFSPCVPCSCNQHSKECDPENGQCMRCDHYTTGTQCEKCAVGFYGDATKGTPEDCRPCPCPLTTPSNQFSRLCKLDTDGNPTCTACQTGYTGRNCERCAKGYFGNPSKTGEKCVKLPVGYLPIVRVRPMKRIKEEGENALFYCFAGGQQKPRFAWSRKNGEPMSRRVSVNGKRLKIKGVTKEDEGTYVCTARNVYGSETASGQLIVKGRLKDPIVISVTPKVLHVPVNHSAQFTCTARSDTDYRLKWTRGMYGALPKGAVNENGVLKIQNTQSIHGGAYTCTGKNSFSDDMASVQLRVGVTSPQVSISPSRLSVREGDVAQFRCSASGFPAPVLQWHGGPGGRLPPEVVLSNGNGLLTFFQVKKIHEGEYFCTASNLGGISSTGTFLNVSAAGSVPVISVSPRSLTVSDGEEALFECTANGDPTPTIRWSRENGQISQSSSSVNGVLRIFSAKPEDEGTYVCRAANTFGAKAILVTLNVEKDTSVAPTALVTPAKQTVDEGSAATLSCQVTGLPFPTIQWNKIGGNLTENHVIEEGLLRIQKVTKEDEGTYVCVAQNKKGVKQATGVIDVRIKVMPKIEIMPTRNLTVTEGETVVFRCVVKAGNPPPAVVWEREENEPLNSSNDGVLVISSASGDSQGKYICKATNVLGSTEAVALLIVQGEPKMMLSPSSSVSVTAGSSVTLECAASAEPLPGVQWITQGHSRSNIQLIESGHGVLKLVIENAKPEDQGNYTCQAQNLVGMTQGTIQLIVKAIPKIEIMPSKKLTVSEGETVVFRCVVKAGNPPPTVVWKRQENEPLNSSNDGVLVISSASGDSRGKYICKATNVLGSTEAVALLIVQGEPKIILSPSSPVSVTAGSSVTLECAAEGNPPPAVQWVTQGHSRSNIQLIESGRGVLKLVIENAGPEDQGNYTCQAQNIAGLTRKSVQLTVKVMPKIEIMPARKLTVTGGETVVFRCVVKAGNPPPAVVWEREENEPLNSSNDGVLVISPASGDSQGKYICKATNVLGSTEAVALLIVQGEPKIIVSPSSPISVTAGSSVTLECAAAGDPPPAVKWVTKEHSQSNLRLIESVRGVLKLVIENARPEDQGNYTCQAQNLVGQTQETIHLLVTVAREPPEILVESVSQRVIQGEEVEFRCNASGIPTPSIIWERLGSNLPDDALDRNGLLTIASVGPEDSGTYTCKAINSEGEDNFNVQLDVIVPPLVYITPFQISVNQGNSFSLFCVVTPSLPVTWSKVNGSIPDGSDNRKGTLSFTKAEVEHSGIYRCHANNSAGSSEGFANVTVFAAPKVFVWPMSLVASPNSNVSFQCNATGTPNPVITWTKEGGDIPKRHTVLNGVFNLTQLARVDNGRYMCKATNAAGASGMFVKLTIEDLPSITIAGGTSVKTVSVGGNLTLECIGTGIPKPKVQWSRVDGPLSKGLILDGGLLIIPNVRHSSGGAYKCEVTNRVGSVQSQVLIFVQEAPKVTVTAQKLRVKIGEPAKFTCIASGSPSPELTWRKINGSLPVSSVIQGGVLRIANMTHEHVGVYVCEATNVEGSANGSAILEIKVTVPRFIQKPLSYLSVPRLTKEPLNFTVEMVFRPEMADGLILYNDQLTNGSVGDFISFGMSNGFAEFRFNLGFEPAIIRSQQPLLPYEWHSVILSRNEKEGNLTVDGKPPVTGVSKGSSTGLNLNQNLYVGGVPDFSAISSLSGFKSGFVGCLSYLAINGKAANIGDPINRLGLEDCEVCQTRPCKNGGTCTEIAVDWRFICSCRPGYSGRTCHDAGQRCSPGVCNEGRCENVGDDGFRCICPAGYSGERCEKGTLIDTPMFEGDSFMSFPGIEGAVRQLKFAVEFMALKSSNMLLLYNGQKTYPARGDFISLAINDGRIEFRFNLGSGPGILRSARNISVGFWHTVTVERYLDKSSLILDDDPPVRGSSQCCSIGLNLVLDLFLGGVENFTTFDTSKVGVSSGLFGCISRMSVDGREINLIKSNLNMRGIKQCTECLLPCELKPCMNNATCIPVGKAGFVCSCAPGYTGQKCEFTLAGHGKNKTCFNGGVEVTFSERLCACPLGYGGKRCKTSVQLGNSASFTGDSFLEFPSSAVRGPRTVKPDYMSLEIKTEARNGVILWQGKRRDHFAIGLRDGFLEFRFELGSGPAVLLSLLPVNDGQWHSFEVFRSFNKGSLKVDNEDHVNGTSAEGSKGLNIDQGSNIFLGGGDKVAELTHGKFDTGFTGCIRKVFFKNRNINLQGDANRGWNVLPCDREIAETT